VQLPCGWSQKNADGRGVVVIFSVGCQWSLIGGIVIEEKKKEKSEKEKKPAL
jgi:hypothetical protein